MLCPPYPGCVPEGAVLYMETTECSVGDVNYDGSVNVSKLIKHDNKKTYKIL